MIDSNGNVVRSVTVKASADRAFEAFTAEMTAWWPPAHHIGTTPIQEIVIEPFTGGRWFGTRTAARPRPAWWPSGTRRAGSS